MRPIKGAIIIPIFYKKRHEAGLLSMISKVLFDRIGKLCNFPLVYTDAPDLTGLDVALVFGIGYHNRPKMPPGLLDADAKLISFYGDLPCYGNKECEKNKRLIFEKSSMIIGGFYETFVKWYPQYVHKYELFSGCFHPYESYARLKLNLKPKMKCLLSGSSGWPYPFREHIKRLCRQDAGGISKLVDIRNKASAPFKEYPTLLNNYFCAIATSGMHSCMVSKYFEIPAAGTLLLAERKKEFDILGFEPFVHYIPITRETVIEQIKKVLSHPKDYMGIRRDAMKFVQRNHSDVNRSLQFKDIMERLIK